MPSELVSKVCKEGGRWGSDPERGQRCEPDHTIGPTGCVVTGSRMMGSFPVDRAPGVARKEHLCRMSRNLGRACSIKGVLYGHLARR